jgi:hypothetical protein
MGTCETPHVARVAARAGLQGIVAIPWAERWHQNEYCAVLQFGHLGAGRGLRRRLCTGLSAEYHFARQCVLRRPNASSAVILCVGNAVIAQFHRPPARAQNLTSAGAWGQRPASRCAPSGKPDTEHVSGRLPPKSVLVICQSHGSGMVQICGFQLWRTCLCGSMNPRNEASRRRSCPIR